MTLQSPDETALIADKTATKVRKIAGITFLVGIMGLTAGEWFVSTHPSLGWKLTALLLLGVHTSELLGSVGLVGLLLEVFGHRELADEILAKIRTLFRVEPDFAKSLSPDLQRRFVKSTLKANLGDDVGEAIFSGLVQRYFDADGKGVYRQGLKYDVDIRNLKEEEVLSDDATHVTFTSSSYFSLSADYSFTRPFSPEAKFIACTFGEDYRTLFEMFAERKYIARETMQIENAHQESFSRLLRSNDEAIQNRVKKIFAIVLAINRETVPQGEVTVDQNGVVVEFKIPDSIPKGEPTEYHVTIRGLIAQSAGKFPVIVSELAWDPEIIFRHPADLRVIPVHFFTGDPSSRPKVRESPGRIDISSEIKGSWVFANSGAVFTWRV